MDTLDSREEEQESMKQELKGAMQGALNSFIDSVNKSMKEFRGTIAAEISSLKEDVAVCKVAVSIRVITASVALKIKVPEPPKFGGKRDAKELDNFIWLVEQYLDALNVVDDSDKLKTTTLYLEHDDILWWRRRHAEMERGLVEIRTWEAFKGELKKQFYPENAKEVAMKKLRGLKHTGSLKDYIQEYSSLMLEIPNMPDKSRLLYFLDGLQWWAEQELKRRGVQDLASAIAVAELLVEFSKGQAKKEKQKKAREGLVIVGTKVNGVDTKALLDSGADQNLISVEEATKLGLKVAKEPGCMKAVDQPAKPLFGVAHGVPLQLGNWAGTIDLSVVSLKDFQLIIGLDFRERVLPFSLTEDGCITFRSAGQDYTVVVERQPVQGGVLSAMQVAKGVKKGEETFLVAYKEEELYLRHFVSANQKDWAKLLDLAQFSYNLQRSESTQQSPFDIATGQQPLAPHAVAAGYMGMKVFTSHSCNEFGFMQLYARTSMQFSGSSFALEPRQD
ncbi:hypothetical protein GH714_033458 [Hevea brasiliensis]|uniref:Peptidase A2 domain-containing protein n=1 Tax=Hevea brasiliensis TaxID=3981 RepID=A0A6A6MR47_HEVBR|nr:hypothetical protein GH714_033458 [Hevea brasiliensis]